MHRMQCQGWWEQEGYGRQPMEQLEIAFERGKLRGTGTDIIGPFRLVGVWEQDHVAIVKQYLGQHHLEYHGTSDGEGVLHGHWGLDGMVDGMTREMVGGKWLIRIGRTRSQEAEQVQDITDLLVQDFNARRARQ